MSAFLCSLYNGMNSVLRFIKSSHEVIDWQLWSPGFIAITSYGIPCWNRLDTTLFLEAFKEIFLWFIVESHLLLLLVIAIESIIIGIIYLIIIKILKNIVNWGSWEDDKDEIFDEDDQILKRTSICFNQCDHVTTAEI